MGSGLRRGYLADSDSKSIRRLFRLSRLHALEMDSNLLGAVLEICTRRFSCRGLKHRLR
jgi:hypothetical protein